MFLTIMSDVMRLCLGYTANGLYDTDVHTYPLSHYPPMPSIEYTPFNLRSLLFEIFLYLGINYVLIDRAGN